MGLLTSRGSWSPTVTSSKATFAYLIGASEADHRDVAHGGDDLVRPVGDRGLADDERHGAALAGLLVEVHDLRPAEVRLARDELPEDLELLLAVEHARDVDAEIAEQRARVRALVAEGHGEGRRRYHVAPRGRRSDSIVQIERIQIPDGSREFFDLSPFDRHREGRVLFADDGPVDLDRHQARPSAILSFVAGAAADHIGHAPVFRVGLALSVAGFALCGAAPSFPLLLAGRAVQGVAGGLVYGTAPALATLGAAASLRGRRLGFLNAAIGLGFASGPVLAGVLVDALGWRAGFPARLPVALPPPRWAPTGRRSPPSCSPSRGPGSGSASSRCPTWRG